MSYHCVDVWRERSHSVRVLPGGSVTEPSSTMQPCCCMVAFACARRLVGVFNVIGSGGMSFMALLPPPLKLLGLDGAEPGWVSGKGMPPAHLDRSMLAGIHANEEAQVIKAPLRPQHGGAPAAPLAHAVPDARTRGELGSLVEQKAGGRGLLGHGAIGEHMPVFLPIGVVQDALNGAQQGDGGQQRAANDALADARVPVYLLFFSLYLMLFG